LISYIAGFGLDTNFSTIKFYTRSLIIIIAHGFSSKSDNMRIQMAMIDAAGHPTFPNKYLDINIWIYPFGHNPFIYWGDCKEVISKEYSYPFMV